ncbi:hypothetical protein L3X38_018283 [Prunus dulcis]|uniref:Uncharacterized protein n=1 Tax=Prunus dulcis TaxID=3755 RepID=A0AAD4W9F9_PRUDU|nr:hypothetical protein L3X38_018283 [Prunus dulcis]
MEGPAVGWTGHIWVGPYCFVTSNARLTCKSIPKLDFGRALRLLHVLEKVGKKRSTVVMVDGSQVEELDALRDNDQLFVF